MTLPATAHQLQSNTLIPTAVVELVFSRMLPSTQQCRAPLRTMPSWLTAEVSTQLPTIATRWGQAVGDALVCCTPTGPQLPHRLFATTIRPGASPALRGLTAIAN